MSNLRRAFSDICRGYTMESWDGRIVYIKHLNQHDQADIDAYQEKMLAVAQKRGITTEKERLAWLKKRGLWTQKDQNDLDNHKVFVDNLVVTHRKMPIKVQRDAIGKQLEEARDKLDEMTTKRAKLVGLTAEQTANSKVQYEYLRRSLFQDPTLQRPLFTPGDIEDMSDEQSNEALLFHINATESFTEANIKRIALAPFFTNYFYLCEEDYTSFFDRAITSLTFFQINLLSWGIYYRNMLRGQEIPNDVREDPEKLEAFIERSKAVREMGAKAPATGGRVGYVGAQSDDFRDWGMEDGTKEMNDLVRGGMTRDSMEEARRRGLI